MADSSVEIDGASAPAAVDRVDRVWVLMAALVCIDFVLGIAAILAVPYSRASGWLPVKGKAVYLPHAVVGALLAVGAVYLVARYGSSPERITRLAARTGIVGLAVGLVGGLLVADHPLRLVGMALMLVGGLAAAIGYCMPSLEAHDRKEREALAARYQEEAGGPVV